MSFRIPSQIMQQSWAAIVVGVATTGYGIYSKARANKKTKDALSKRKAYTTQDETFQILNALENRSQGDTQTRGYQTQQIDNSFSQQLGVAELLGADPNDLSALFNQKMQGIIQVGQNFHASNMEAFGKYLGGLDMVAKSRDAEYGSQQNIVKDQIQAAAADGQAANQTINSGINTVLSGYSAAQSNKLYKDYQKSLNSGAVNSATTAATSGADAGFDNAVIKDAITPASAQSFGYAVEPNRISGVGVQSMNLTPKGNIDYTQDAGFLAWLQNNGAGTKR